MILQTSLARAGPATSSTLEGGGHQAESPTRCTFFSRIWYSRPFPPARHAQVDDPSSRFQATRTMRRRGIALDGGNDDASLCWRCPRPLGNGGLDLKGLARWRSQLRRRKRPFILSAHDIQRRMRASSTSSSGSFSSSSAWAQRSLPQAFHRLRSAGIGAGSPPVFRLLPGRSGVFCTACTSVVAAPGWAKLLAQCTAPAGPGCQR